MRAMLPRPARPNPAKRPTVVGRSIPAPVGGWNAISPLAAMDVKDAVILDNWIPRAGYVEVRKGSRAWAIGASDPVESLLVYRGNASGVDEMYAAAGPKLFDVTTLGTGFGTDVKDILSARIQSINFSNDGDQWLLCYNGAQDPFLYDGASWTDLTITGSSGSITLDPEDLIDAMSHKRRIHMLEKDTLHVWCLPVNAIQGAASLLDLGPVMQKGGALIALATWTLDGGSGPDDLAVYVTDQGEVAIYQGTDPGDPLNWALTGVYDIGIPLGRRSLMKYGADLFALTTNGVLPLSQALSRDRAADEDVALTAKIQNAFSISAQSYLTNFGWSGITYQRGTLAIYNVPTAELSTAVQYVQNVQTGSWCRFTGLNAFCWCITDNAVFYGGAQGVYQWDVGVTDAGTDLVADMKQAFNYFGDRGSLKRFTMLRPTMNVTANISPAIEMLVDYQEREPIAVPTNTIVDRDGTLRIRDEWTSVTGVGYCGSVRTRVKLAQDPDLTAFLAIGDGDIVGDGAGNDIVIDSGDPLDAQIQLIATNVLFQKGGQL